MSEIHVRIETPPGADKRVQRTRQLLAEALLSLGAESGLDDFAVGDLVDEAGVSRSTFYQHFSSKDDFLIRSWVDLLAATDVAHAAHYPNNTDVLPTRPVFHHVAAARNFVRELVKSEIFARQMEAGEAKLREIAEARLMRRMPHWSAERRRETAVFVAAGFVGLLRWWMQTGQRQPPERMQETFERLSASILSEADAVTR